MPTSRTPAEQVAFMARAHHRGILCPSECWRQIAEALTPATVNPILNGLEPDARNWLLEMYQDRPPVAYVRDCADPQGSEDLRQTCAFIVSWCETQSPTELPPEPDGIIRVRVDQGMVVEWR